MMTAKNLVDIITYNGLFDSQDLLGHPEVATWLEQNDPEKKVCYIEWYSPGHPILWTIDGWIDNCKKRKRESELLEEHRLKPKEPSKPVVITPIKLQIIQAIQAGDWEKVKELQKQK